MSVTWQQLCELEPRLARVIQRATEDRSSRPNWCAYEQHKSRITSLVGWMRNNPPNDVLDSREAYELTVRKLVEALKL